MFGAGFTAGRGFNYLAQNGDNAVVGNRMTASALGVYGRAYQLAVTPALLLGQMIDRVIFPVIARFQSDRKRVAQAYLRGVALIAILTGPGSVLAVVLGHELVHVMLGRKWGAVVLPFQVLSVGLWCRTSYKISDSLARATGTVYKRAWRQAVYAGAVVSGALAGAPFGLPWVAFGVLLAIVVNYLLMADLSIRTIGVGWRDFFACQSRGVLLSMLTLAVSLPTAHVLRTTTHEHVLTILGTSLAAVLALLLAALFAPQKVLGPELRWLRDVVRGRPALEPVDDARVP